MLLVSFCDIVTIVTCAMFMAMIVVIDQSMKIPVVTPVPLLRGMTNQAVYFECRNQMVYPVDRDGLRKVFEQHAADYKQGGGSMTTIERLTKMDAGNDIYRLDYNTALMGVLGLQGRPGVKGISEADVIGKAENPYAQTLKNIAPATHFIVFFVRDDSFEVFRKARDQAVTKGFKHGWEFLARDEPITFEGVMSNIGAL